MVLNRLGQRYVPTVERVDRAPNLVANIMLRRPKIQGCKLLPDGCVKFNLPWKGTGMTMADLRGSRLVRSRWFGNVVGEFLVRINLHQFDSIVLDATCFIVFGMSRFVKNSEKSKCKMIRFKPDNCGCGQFVTQFSGEKFQLKMSKPQQNSDFYKTDPLCKRQAIGSGIVPNF